jgi:hypothetical protein
MTIFDLFSKRQRQLRGEVPDVYVYDKLPQPFRVQVVHILRDMLGNVLASRYGVVENGPYRSYKDLVEALRREYGLFELVSGFGRNDDFSTELFNFFLAVGNVEQALDVIELATRYADRVTRKYEYQCDDFDRRVDNGVAELNARFREHGIGFQYERGELIRLDSDFLHAEAVKPALTLLRMKEFAGPREEFLNAHDHYRHARYEEALTEALKSFESTMKAICDSKGWAYESKFPAKDLVNVCFKNNLIDEFWQTHISSLRGTLENGINTARNKLGAHGQGSTPREVPRELVAYVLHMTAATIVFLIEAATSKTKAS